MKSGRGSVLVIGGGPAGLTASVNLRAAGFRVTLIDQVAGGCLLGDSPVLHQQPVSKERTADALPYVALGADRATIALLGRLGTAKRVQFSRALHYEFYARPRRITRLRRPSAPTSLRAILSLAAFPALSLQDRRRILSFLERTWEKDPPLELDLNSRTAERWLEQIGQSDQARRFVWGPLARFLLGDDLPFVSARHFVEAMTRCFLSNVRNAMLAVPSDGLVDLFGEPALAHLHREEVSIRRPTAVNLLRFDAQRVTEVQLEGGHSLRADWYVLDVPHHRFTALLPDRFLARYAYFQHIGRLQDVPAITVHLWLTDNVIAPRVLLLGDHVFHWLISRRLGPKGRMGSLVSLVAVGRRIARDEPDRVLVQTAADLVTQAFSLKTGPQIVRSAVVRTPRAFLAIPPGTEAFRPVQQSPVSNLLVVGSWTDTNLPATLESAIYSGNLCADAIIGQGGESVR